MNNAHRSIGLVAGLALAGSAGAAEILVTNNITTSTTWTANNTYNLQNQIYVMPGATLTIEAGTVIASDVTANGGGSLAVTRGGKIHVLGTVDAPVIMTSKNDDFMTWREACNEWGNLTVMGNAYISNSYIPGNTADPNPNNSSPMEGLIPDGPGDTKVLYGGGDDDDDSGTINYLSLRYGGRVVGLANELNGLSLGGIGRGTEICHVEIMNNVDDGIEIWGGTVNLKYVTIWNIGDDCFDNDQGWRGKAQFGLLVQGYSIDAAQGSGVGDNMFETDGAEDSDAQPVTTSCIYNFTAIGQPVTGAGDHGTAWRDNARVQYHNCIFMDLGDRVVSFDNSDGDGAQGYGYNGTLSWASTWTTNYDVYSMVNAPANPADFYQSQTSGKLASITDSVFFRNLATNAYAEANARGVFNAGNNNVLIPGFDDVDSPIVALTRQTADADGDGQPGVTRGGKIMLRVLSIDPRAANEAASSVGAAPDDGFFTPVSYRGGFAPDENWLCGWTACDAYGFVVHNDCVDLPCNTPCPNDLDGSGSVDFGDLLLVLSAWGNAGGNEDLDSSGTVDFGDVLVILSNWGPCS